MQKRLEDARPLLLLLENSELARRRKRDHVDEPPQQQLLRWTKSEPHLATFDPQLPLRHPISSDTPPSPIVPEGTLIALHQWVVVLVAVDAAGDAGAAAECFESLVGRDYFQLPFA